MSVVYSLTEKVAFIESAFGKGNLERSGNNINVRCPIPECTSRKDRTKRKLAIRVVDDANHCWVCGWRSRSLLPLLTKYGSHSLVEKYLERFYTGTRRSGLAIVENAGTADEKRIELPKDFAPLAVESTDPDARAIVRYLSERGIGEDDLWYFKIGRSDEQKWRRRALLPSFDADGNLNFFIGRAIDDRMRPKYDNPNVPASELVFNEINVDWAQRIVLCEGPFDLMKCGQNATCLLGSTLSEESLLFERLLAHKTPVALALDTDARRKMMKIANLLAEYDIDVSIVSMGEKNDPGEMSKDEFAAAVAAARPWSWEAMMSTKMERLSVRLGM